MERVFCPRHEERTPSCVIYETHAYCYGGCGRIELAEIGRNMADKPTQPKYVEDLCTKLSYIDSLPQKPIRGFEMPHDDQGYYVVWPDRSYYKLRLWDAPSGNKYRGPAGHPKPPFWVRRWGQETLALVEGEVNAMSISAAFLEWDVCSPGSASDFKTDKTRSFLLTYCTRYCTVVVITDRDGPGTEAAITTKGLLLGKVPSIPIILLEQDANQVLCDKGKEALRETITKSLPNVRDGVNKA